MVEFALVLPMLLVLLLGIADFGRAFHAGITIRAAARDAAEVAAQEYLQLSRNGAAIDYAELHRTAAKVACEETQSLPETTFQTEASGPGGTCPSMPKIRVCIHDGSDPNCGQPIGDFAADLEDCDRLDGNNQPTAFDDPAWDPLQDGDGGASNYIEVRVCYRFTVLFPGSFTLPMSTGITLGDVWLQERAVFTVADY